ncbi:hypothetical protein I4U23_013225 [Adineta vaga]|nr:hypothetical protein I4U23_013225 [Adineta vaga]
MCDENSIFKIRQFQRSLDSPLTNQSTLLKNITTRYYPTIFRTSNFKPNVCSVCILWNIFDTFIYAIIPFLLILISSIIIIVKICERRRSTIVFGGVCHTNSRIISTQDKLSMFLILINCLFLIMTGPFNTYLIIQSMLKYFFSKPCTSKITTQLNEYLRLLQNSYHALSFIFYCLIGNKFRQSACSTMESNTNTVLNTTESINTDPLMKPEVNVVSSKQLSETLFQRFSGIFYAAFSAFLITVSIFITKQLDVDLLEALIPRFIVQSILLFIYMKFVKHYTFYKQTSKGERLLLFVNAFSSTTGFFAFFFAYRYLSLPDATTIRYSQVIWTAILSAIVYREKPSIPMILATILTTIGVTCVAQPTFLFDKTSNLTMHETSFTNHQQRSIALLIVLYSSIAMSIMIVSNKHLLYKYKTKHSLIVLQYAFISLCIMVIYCFYKYYFLSNRIESLKTNFFNWKYACASIACLLQIVSSTLVQKALKREPPSIFTIIQSSDILFSILLQNAFSSVKSNLLSIFGSILVLTSIIIISTFKFFNERKMKKNIEQPR